jgi:hypothetical protein
MPLRIARAVLLGATLSAALARPGFAAWPTNPLVNLPICTVPGNQLNPAIASDGSSGAIIAWDDGRGTAPDIYAQHVLSTGIVDPAWPLNGRALCTASGFQNLCQIVSDGAHGAIVTWTDYRGGLAADIYAQHVLASGAVDPAWPVNGRALCTALSHQLEPMIVSDGAGGAIVTWDDIRSGPHDIYAQHVKANGAVDAAWPLNGRAICNAASDQFSPTIVADGAGGAIITWRDGRSLTNSDIYAQHVLASGAVDPAWPLNGRAICTFTRDQITPTIVSDGAAGAIIAWPDARPGTGYYDIYAQHLLASGVVDGAWPADGRALCTNAADQNDLLIVADGGGGAIAVWRDQRALYDIYVQCVRAGGAVDPFWPVDGRAVCTDPGGQNAPQIVADETGGAIITWADLRSADNDIYAQRVLPNGQLGGDDPTPVLVSLVRAEADSRAVRLEWFVSTDGSAVANIYRRTRVSEWLAVAAVNADGTGRIRYEDRSVEPGIHYGYRIGIPDQGTEQFSAEAWVTVPVARGLAIEEASPNPFDRELVVSFSLPSAEPAAVELMDLSGRTVARRALEAKPGVQAAHLQGRALAAGIYVGRLSQGGRSVTQKVCVVH